MNYTITHLHSMDSNGTTNIDSINKFEDYIQKAKEYGMKAIAFTEHGNCFQWTKKKEECEKNGLKYIHAVEIYITETLEERIRDNYHTCLYALNYDGVEEINNIITTSYNRKDNHFYYMPRISIDEFVNISDNIAVSSACLAGVINSEKDKLKKKYLDYFIKNKHRCFLEIQHHNVQDQIKHNKMVYKISCEHNIPLITGTDTHSLDKKSEKGRVILQKSKNIHFGNEDGWDLTLKSYDELIRSYEKQSSLPMDIVKGAIENTNKLADMVEEFELDKSYKYPKLYNNAEKVFKDKIVKGMKRRGKKSKVYKDRVKHEFESYKKTDTIDYLLLEEDIANFCKENGIHKGYSRGSVSGSVIAYFLDITEMDSVKHNLNFERFINPDRVSLADIDSDYSPKDRDKVKEYIYSKKGLYCADIITFNTIALKGAIRDVCRAFEIPLDEVDTMTKEIEYNEKRYRKKYPEIFEYVDMLQGVIVSVGSHPAGIIVSPHPIEGRLGTVTLSTNEYPVVQINMKEVDDLNYVKLDILGLKNIGIINETCKLAGIERLTPDNVDENDINVWNSIRDNTLGIFQWESDSAADYCKKLFSEETLAKIKEVNPNFSYIDLFSIGNGAIRPAGESYRNALANGEFNDNGHPALNDFLSNTMMWLVFQEQVIDFLNKFCGFTKSEADIVRRGFAKKTRTEQYIPQIKDGFIKTMTKNYGLEKIEAERLIESFIRVIEDASSYLFSVNHSSSYSYIGYVCGYLRYYYPLEFLTVLLNFNKDNMDKTNKIMEYINNFTDISLKPIRFRYSRGEYFFDKETNSIYEGVSSVKTLNDSVGEQLYELRDREYETFTDLLVDITEETSVNSKVKPLIYLNYFSEFGLNGKLLDVYEMFAKRYKRTHKDNTKEKRIAEVKEYEESVEDKKIPFKKQIELEQEYLNHAITKEENAPDNFYIVVEFDNSKNKSFPRFLLHHIKTGKKIKPALASGQKFVENSFGLFDILRVDKFKERKKRRKINGEYKSTDELEQVLTKWQVV